MLTNFLQTANDEQSKKKEKKERKKNIVATNKNASECDCIDAVFRKISKCVYASFIEMERHCSIPKIQYLYFVVQKLSLLRFALRYSIAQIVARAFCSTPFALPRIATTSFFVSHSSHFRSVIMFKVSIRQT